MLETNPPKHFRRNIKLLIAAANQFNAHTVLATFAHCPGFEDEPWVSDPVFAAVYPEMNRVITEIAENTDAELFDFASAFPTSETGYFTDGIHMNADGAHLKAELFAGYLETQALIPERYRN
jgi:lysophospholipase L1-like esterase